MTGTEREPDAGGRTWRLSARQATLLVSVGAAAVLALGAAIGVWWQAQRADVRTRELQAAVQRLRAERNRTLELTARLDSAEARYARLRRLMTGELAPSERDVALPLPPRPIVPEESADGEAAGDWSWPLTREGFVTRRFEAGDGEGHGGVDVAIPSGSYVRAARAGLVEAVGAEGEQGRFVRLRHDPSTTSVYGGLAWIFVADGDSVERDEVLALSGGSGRSAAAPHLHFAIVREGRPVDPLPILENAFEPGRAARPPSRPGGRSR